MSNSDLANKKSVGSTHDSILSTSSAENAEETNFFIFNRATQKQIHIVKNWSPEEEKRAKRKIDFLVMPLLLIAFFILQIDRGNIANALTDTLMEDIGINTDQVNVGTALFNIGIVIFEIPANMVLQKLGPSKWLSLQVLVWSLIATLQSQIKNYSSFLATRFLLGMFESGFIPGALFYLSTWYTKKELALRYTIYFVGNLTASACSGLIAAGILKNVALVDGIAGWKWIFIIEGVIGVGYGIIFAIAIPESAAKSRPFWAPAKWNFLTERETYILSQRVIVDDPEKACNDIDITLKDVWAVLHIPTVWAHFILSLASMIMSQALSTYIPLIIKTFGYTAVEANARSSIANWIAIFVLLGATYTSNHFKPRGATISFLSLWKFVFIIVLLTITTSTNATKKFAILVLLTMCGASVHVLNTSWVSVNSKTPTERSIALALMVMAANIAGICGGQVMRDNDKPYYKKGFLAIVVVNAFTLLWAIGLTIWYYIANRKLDKESPLATELDSSSGADVEKANPSQPNKVIIFVGKGDKSNDEQILTQLQGEYDVQDKEAELVSGLRNFRYSP